jgi:hypothetical protein
MFRRYCKLPIALSAIAVAGTVSLGAIEPAQAEPQPIVRFNGNPQAQFSYQTAPSPRSIPEPGTTGALLVVGIAILASRRSNRA